MRIHIAPMPKTDEEREALIKRMMREGCDDLILLQTEAGK
jgi:hypothetical protein